MQTTGHCIQLNHAGNYLTLLTLKMKGYFFKLHKWFLKIEQ